GRAATPSVSPLVRGRVRGGEADGNCTSVSLQGGGVTRTYSWGYNNELKQITYAGGGTNTFTHDGIGRRVTKVDSTGSYSFGSDGSRILSDGHAVYTRAGDSRLISERRGNNSRWHHSDGLTSTRTLTSNRQNVPTFQRSNVERLMCGATSRSGQGTPRHRTSSREH
ncbi:MAG: hypothetical protein RMK49_22255, partial [Abditibacteriales bacterium]|nr:hypothetical protein [Abditibacteriales bacterium]